MKKYVKYIIVLVILIALSVSICFIPISVSRFIPTLEKQLSYEIGANVHIDKLILRVGPYIKLKSPQIHITYDNGKKFAQLDNVKIYIPVLSVLKKEPKASMITARKLIIKATSNDKQLNKILEKFNSKDINSMPNIYLKSYKLTYDNYVNTDKYVLEGQEFTIEKIVNYKNVKIITNGNFYINHKKYLKFDLCIVPKFDITNFKNKGLNVQHYINKMKELNFYSDIIADVKLYKNQDNNMQATGYINTDNICISGELNKNPKSFIYITFWGDKANISSNIYLDNDKKVSVEGLINNSKKPNIDIKVKTNEISINKLYKKLSFFTNFSELNKIKNINGKLYANFSLKGDLSKIKSSGFMKITNANIITQGFNIDRINADIDFSNNKINILNATGCVNNSPIIAKGYIDKNIDVELLMDKVELKYISPSILGIKSGIVSAVANINGTLDNIIHKENIQINKLEMVNKYGNLSIDSFEFNTNKNNIALIKNLIYDTDYLNKIKIPTMKLFVDHEQITIPETNVFMPNSKFVLSSFITNYNSKDISFNVNLNGNVYSKDIKFLNNYTDTYPLLLTLNGNKITQNILAQAYIQNSMINNDPLVLNLSSKIEKNNLKIDDLSLILPSDKFTKDTKSNIKGQKKVIISGNVEDIGKPCLKNLRLLVPTPVKIKYNSIETQAKGDIFINGNINSPEIVGQVSLSNLIDNKLQMSIINCNLDFNKNLININAPSVKIADSVLSLNATALSDIKENIIIKTASIKSKYLNIDNLAMYKDVPITKIKPIIINEGKLYSDKISTLAYGTPLVLTAVSSDFKLCNNILEFKNFTSDIYNGKLVGTISQNLINDVFDVNLMARNVSATPIFSIISNKNEAISGIMDFDMSLKGNIYSKQSLNGNIKFIIHNGKMSTLGKLEHLLYAQNVIADNMLRTSLSVVTKAITLKNTGLFKYLRGDIDLLNGIANINIIQSQGPSMALFIRGKYNPVNDYAQLTVLGRISDDVISGLGAFGEFSFNKLMIMLTGEETKYKINYDDFNKIPYLQARNTKEFRSIIDGAIDKPSSVLLFNWVSYSQKSLKQKEVPLSNVKLPSFLEELPD